tara:strand:- start:3381 stop:5354 length:1974 start_codon:yes stop_codon:yes gene_type:complete
MSYENPTTVVDTESARIRAAGMASFGQSVGSAITVLGQRQREEAKANKKANKDFLNSQTKYNEEYQQKSWTATDQFKDDAGFDISPQVTKVFNQWADEGARLKAERDRSDDPEERRKLGSQIAVYDKFFLGGGMTNNLESFAEMQKTIQANGGPGKAGDVGGLSLSSLKHEVYRDFMGMGKGNGGGAISITGMGGQVSEDGQYAPLSLTAGFKDGGTYDMSNLNNNLITVPNMQDGVVDVLQKAGYIAGNKLNTNSEGFKDFIKTDDGKVEYTSGYDTNGNEIRYQSLDFDKMYNALDPTFQATIVGYTNEGSVADGDSSLGLQTMQSYVDDELEEMSDSDKEIFKEKVGVYPEEISLQIGEEKNTILDKESLDLYKKALTAQKFIELQKQMPGEKVNETDTGYKGTKGERDVAILTNDFNDTVSVSIREGGGITDLYNQVKRSPLDYNYEDNQFDNKVRSQKDYKEEIENSTPQELYDQGLVATFTESERKNPYQTNSDEFKNSVQEKMNNYLATLGDKEDVFVNYDTGEELREEQALTMLFKSTPKYSNLESSEIKKMVNQAMKERPEKPDEEFKEDVTRFQTDNVDDVESGEFSKEYKSATEEIASYSSPFFSRFRPDEVAKRKKERSKIVTKQKKDRKLLEEKYPNVTWPWEK